MTIISTSNTADGVTVQVRRTDGSIYTIDLLPKDEEVVVNFSGISDADLYAKREYTNRVLITIDRG